MYPRDTTLNLSKNQTQERESKSHYWILTDISDVEGAKHNHPLGSAVDVSIFVKCIMGYMKDVEPSKNQH